MSAVQNKEVTQTEVGQRLDRWFKQHYPAISFARLQKLLRTGQIRLDGKRVDGTERLELGQVLRIPPLNIEEKKPGTPLKVDLRWLNSLIIYKDDNIIAINKPTGLAVQGGTKTEYHLDGMLEHLKFKNPERPRLVHRIDKDTSGILLLARNAKTAKELAQWFKEGKIRKIYLALVVGVPKIKAGEVDAPLAKLTGAAKEKMGLAEEDGQKAITLYQVVDQAHKTACLLELEPKTGRTHQLRVHCALMETPILGDGKYGGTKAFMSGFSKQLHLHAYSLQLPGPKGLIIKAEFPPHIKESVQTLGLQIHR